MNKLQVQNRKGEYIARSQIGLTVTEKQIVTSNYRNDFEARADGYFVWKCSKKNETQCVDDVESIVRQLTGEKPTL